MKKVRLGLNVDHIATLRQARGGNEPDPIAAAAIGEMAGADGITVHLRSDRRHMQDRDIELLMQTVKTHLNVEMAATGEMITIATRLKPHMVTLVPERPGEVTTEGGLDVVKNFRHLSETVEALQSAGITVSIFIDPTADQIKASKETGTQVIEINTDAYSKALTEEDRDATFAEVKKAATAAATQGLRVVAGHGLTYWNAGRIASLPEIEELNIGHNIIARASLVGLEKATRDMIESIRRAE